MKTLLTERKFDSQRDIVVDENNNIVSNVAVKIEQSIISAKQQREERI
jgi:hypothetical protein